MPTPPRTRFPAAFRVLTGLLPIMIVLGGTSFGVAAYGGTGASSVTITGSALVARLIEDGSFDGRDIGVNGDVDLRRAGAGWGPLRCRQCSFRGALLAADATFRGVVDLSGSTVTRKADLRGASFERGLVWSGGTIGQEADFELALFGGRAAFDDIVFTGAAGFSGAGFVDAATFAGADFLGPAGFDNAAFGSSVSFTGVTVPPQSARAGAGTACETAVRGAFGNQVTFRHATVRARADFRGRCFAGPADLTGLHVAGRTDFGSAQFLAPAGFSGASFGDEVSFDYARFLAESDFAHVLALGRVSFDRADIRADLYLTGAHIVADLSCQDVFARGALHIDELTYGGLLLDRDNVDWISGAESRMGALARIESTARSRGDTDTANDARYELLRRHGDLRSDWRSILTDRIAYRLIAGYLVRPWAPIRAFLLLLVLACAIRVLAGIRGRRRPATLLVESVLATAEAAARLKPVEAGDLAHHRATPTTWVLRLEYVAFKALSVLVVLNVGNANATVHDFIDSLLT